MLNDEQAIKIVGDCIRAVSHIDIVDTTASLDENEISDSLRINNLITLIVNSNAIGVPSVFHRISPSVLSDVSSDTIVNELIDTVRDESTEVQVNFIEELASLMSTHLLKHLQINSNKKDSKSSKTLKASHKKSGGKG